MDDLKMSLKHEHTGIEPLQWSHHRSVDFANSILGNYGISGGRPDGRFKLEGPGIVELGDSVEELMALAQGHFDERIRSVLSPGDDITPSMTYPDHSRTASNLLDQACLTLKQHEQGLYRVLHADIVRALQDAEGRGIERAATFIENHQVAHTGAGDVIDPRTEGNRNGLAYAGALRLLAGPQALLNDAEQPSHDDPSP